MIAHILNKRLASTMVLAGITFYCLIGASRLQPVGPRPMPVPESDPARQALVAMGDHFGGSESVTFVVESPDVLSNDAIDTVKALTEEAKTLPGVSSSLDVVSLATIMEIRSDESGLSLKPMIEESRRANLPERVRTHPLVNGILVNAEHNATLVVATVGKRAIMDEMVTGLPFQKSLYEAAENLVHKYSRNGVKVSATGELLVLYLSQNFIRKELVNISLIAVACLILVMLISFRSWVLTGLSVAIMLLSVIWTLGVMGWLSIPISTSTIYVVIVIMAVGSSYAIHVVATIGNRSDQVKSKRVAIKLALADVALPLLTVSLAAALSSVSLLSFDISDIRELGVLQGLGTTIAYALSYFLLPTLVMMFGTNALRARKARPGDKEHWIDQAIQKALNVTIYLPLHKTGLSTLLVALVVVTSVVGIAKVVPSFVLERTIPRSTLPRDGFERILETFGPFSLASVIIERKDSGSLLDPDGLRKIEEIQKILTDIPEVRLLASLPDGFRQFNLAIEGKADLPATRDAVDQSLMMVGRSKLSRILDRSGKRTLIKVSLNAPDPKRMSAVIREIQSKLSQVPGNYFAQIGGTPVMLESMNRYIVENKIISILSCFVIVLILCSIVHSSISLGFISVASAAVAALGIFGIMGFTGVHLDISSATITTIAIGVGVDAAVHYLLQFRADLSEHANRLGQIEKPTPQTYRIATRATTKRYGKTIVFDSLSNILGFVPLLFSSFPLLKVAGMLLVVNQILVVFSTFFVTPLLILILKPDLPKKSMRGTQIYELRDELQ